MYIIDIYIYIHIYLETNTHTYIRESENGSNTKAHYKLHSKATVTKKKKEKVGVASFNNDPKNYCIFFFFCVYFYSNMPFKILSYTRALELQAI